MTQLFEWIKWLVVELPQPKELEKLVNLGGPWWVGYLILSSIVFSETGLLVGFFLPGDSLLFSAGLLASQNVFNILALNGLLIAAAVAGDAVNYYFGLKMEERVFEKGRMRFVKHSHLVAAKEFYERHGGKAIVLARFFPFIRTFTPFVAGVARMEYRRFVVYNIAGGAGWVILMTTAGYTLGQIDWIQKNFEKCVWGIIAVSLLPVFWGALKHWLMPAPPAAEPELAGSVETSPEKPDG